jgi:hypothetical protein
VRLPRHSPLVEAARGLGGVCDHDALGDGSTDQAQPAALGGRAELVEPGGPADGAFFVLVDDDSGDAQSGL